MNPWTYVGRHRAEGPAVTRLPHHRFAPRHCAGKTCVHEHLGEAPRPVFARIWKRDVA